MKYKKILLTGASGKLGHAIVNSGYFSSLLTPSMDIFNITKPDTLEKFFDSNEIDAVIHCAAFARMKECEENPVKAVETNIIGTSNLVMEVIRKEKKIQKKIRFVHISTDGVYPSTRGNYTEKDETIPYNTYGWTKLGAECTVNLLSNFCIIRTRFFDTKTIPFTKSAIDAYTSGIPINYLVKSIVKMLENNFIGTINIGGERKSDYERYKEYKPSLKPCKLNDILREISFKLHKNASMDCSLWNSIK